MHTPGREGTGCHSIAGRQACVTHMTHACRWRTQASQRREGERKAPAGRDKTSLGEGVTVRRCPCEKVVLSEGAVTGKRCRRHKEMLPL